MGEDAADVGSSGGELLVAVARRLFLEHGYANVSMQAIAKEAGMTKGAPYYYFPSKEALFLAVSREVLVTLRDAMTGALAKDAPLRERLCAALGVVVNSTSDDLSNWLTDLKLVLLPEGASALIGETIGSHDIATIFLPALQDAEVRGEIGRVSPQTASRVISRLMMACMSECSYWRLAGSPDVWNAETAVTESVDVFLHGVTTA